MSYIIVFFISMVPLIELRGAIPYAIAQGLPYVPSYIIAILGNMLPVPFIYLFARKVLLWGADKPVIGKFFTYCIEKGEKGRKETSGDRRKRPVCGTAAVRRYSASGNRSMDRNTCGKLFGYGF